jgi:predicted transcriptional regulator
MGTPAAHIERLLAPLAHEGRLGLMQVLYGGRRTSGQLTEATGLRGGNLHYHLKELLHAHYVEQQDGGYGLTGLGTQMLLTVAAIASLYVKDRGDEGLEVLGGWSNDGT